MVGHEKERDRRGDARRDSERIERDRRVVMMLRRLVDVGPSAAYDMPNMMRELDAMGLGRPGGPRIPSELLDSLVAREREFLPYMPPSVQQEFSALLRRATSDDSAVAELNPWGSNITFVLGAGASKPPPTNIPTVRELLPLVLQRARSLDREDLAKLADYCNAKDINNIEDVLTAAQLGTFCGTKPKVLSLMDFLRYGAETEESARMRRYTTPSAASAFIQDTLQVLFGLLSREMLPAPPNDAHSAIAGYVKEHPRSSIVTTNYDCCMDRALGENGKQFDYRIPPEIPQPGPPLLLKLRGSLNWFYCDTCQQVQLLEVEPLVRAFNERSAVYPVIGVCQVCGGQNRQLLVPPQAMKFDIAPPLTPLLVSAQAAFKTASLIVVVGFSFAEADQYITRMVRKSMQDNPKQQLLVVDPDHTVARRLRRKFLATITNFDESRILSTVRDGAEFLPGFLARPKDAPVPHSGDGGGASVVVAAPR